MKEYENTEKERCTELTEQGAGERKRREESGNGGTEMEHEIRKYKKGGGNIFWGVVLVAGAMLMLLNKLGYFHFGGMPFWNIIFSLCLAALVFDGLRKGSFGKIVFGLAFLIIVNDKLLHLEAITPWPVLLAACAITVGLNLLFPGFHRFCFVYRGKGSGKRRAAESESREGDAVFYENTFGSTVKYITGEIASVHMENSFGSMEVYFSDAIPKNGSVNVHISSSFGGVVLYVPSDWRVVRNVESAFGGVEEEGHFNPAGETVLYIDGELSFSGLEIKYL